MNYRCCHFAPHLRAKLGGVDQRATPIFGRAARGHHFGHWPTFLVPFFFYGRYHESLNLSEFQCIMTFKRPYFHTRWSYSHTVWLADCTTATVHTDVTLTRSKIRVNIMELLNFQKLAKTCVHAGSDYCQPLLSFSSLKLDTLHVAQTRLWNQWRQSVFVIGVFYNGQLSVYVQLWVFSVLTKPRYQFLISSIQMNS